MPEEQRSRPPIGLIPRRFAELQWLVDRNKSIVEAIHRYVTDNRTIPEDWVTEYNWNIQSIYNIQQLPGDHKPWLGQ